MNEGNEKLRKMSQGKARALAKIGMMNDEKAKARYRQYNEDERQIKATYGAEYRAVGSVRIPTKQNL